MILRSFFVLSFFVLSSVLLHRVVNKPFLGNKEVFKKHSLCIYLKSFCSDTLGIFKGESTSVKALYESGSWDEVEPMEY